MLNAGSGGNDYGICCEEMHHIDITEEKIKNCKHYRSSKHEEFTYKNESFDAIISVRSLLNYWRDFKVLFIPT